LSAAVMPETVRPLAVMLAVALAVMLGGVITGISSRH
jgi:hypothetical protein